MAEKRRVFKPEFRERAVRIVTETGKPIGEVADDLGINETTLASWVSRAKRAEKGKPAEVGCGDGAAAAGERAVEEGQQGAGHGA